MMREAPGGAADLAPLQGTPWQLPGVAYPPQGQPDKPHPQEFLPPEHPLAPLVVRTSINLNLDPCSDPLLLEKVSNPVPGAKQRILTLVPH